jgi:hypothetical protein
MASETCGACGHLRTYHDDGECPPTDFIPSKGPRTMRTLEERHADQLALLHDPTAFAEQIYSLLFSNTFEALFLSDEIAEGAGWDAARALIVEIAAAGGDVEKALEWTSEAVFVMATVEGQRSLLLGSALEQLRRNLLAALEIRINPEDDRARIETALKKLIPRQSPEAA